LSEKRRLPDGGQATAEAVKQAGKDASEAASQDWCGILLRMAEIPAEGIVGLAVKAAQVCRTLSVGDSEAGNILADSLRADIARLVPAAAVT
jgi:hypothetical protein